MELSEAIIMATRRMAACVKNGRAGLTEKSATELLLEGSRGAYTTARTWKQQSIFRFKEHIERLANSVKLIVDNNSTNPQEELLKLKDVINPGTLEPIVRKELEVGMQFFFKSIEPSPDDEVRITILISWEHPEGGHDFDIDSHYMLLPPRSNPPISTLLLGAPRSNAAAKDSQWIRDKQWLEDARGGRHFEEVLLVTEDGGVLEGTQTNFFAIYDGKLWTANDGVLDGTVRGVVLRAAKELNIPVELKPPCLTELPRWEGCFITSTSRLVMNVDSVTLHHALFERMSETTKQEIKELVNDGHSFTDVEVASPSVLSPTEKKEEEADPLHRQDLTMKLKGSKLITMLEDKVASHLEDSSVAIWSRGKLGKQEEVKQAE